MFVCSEWVQTKSLISQFKGVPIHQLRPAAGVGGKLSTLYEANQYLVEFRGLHADFRLNELMDSVEREFLLMRSADKDPEDQDQDQDQDQDEIDDMLRSIRETSTTVIFDNIEPTKPMCVYLSVPAPYKQALVRAASRCALVRSISEVWGDGPSLEQCSEMVSSVYDSKILPLYPLRSSIKADKVDVANTWRVNFRRYGKGKCLDTAQKSALLSQFPILKRLYLEQNAQVDLIEASHSLVYLEDWATYNNYYSDLSASNDSIRKEKKELKKLKKQWKETGHVPTDTETADAAIVVKKREQIYDYTPLRCIFGETLVEPIAVEPLFDIKPRPFIGTTTMECVCAHLTAVAAGSSVGRGKCVLDPFSGTGGIILAAAYLGASVVGSDVDAGSMGIFQGDKKGEAVKNTNFRRHGLMKDHDQGDLDTSHNFIHYEMEDRLEALRACDVREWLKEGGGNGEDENIKLFQPNSDHNIREMLFDAILTDPPYARRERAVSALGASQEDMPNFATSAHMGDPMDVLCSLMQVAQVKVKKGGKLVFWYPSDAEVDETEVWSALERVRDRATEETSKRLDAENKENKENKGVEGLEGHIEDHIEDHIEGYPRPIQRQLKLKRITPQILHNRLWRWLVVFTVD